MKHTGSVREYGSFIAGMLLAAVACSVRAETIETELLIVGANEAGCAAAVQAARLGVKKIVLVNDIDWLGGQFSAEGVGPVDERTVVQGKSANFPRSGLLLELIRRIRAYNSRTYGVATPGNCWSATDTIEPSAAAALFEDLIAPYTEKGSGQLRLIRGWQTQRVLVDGTCVKGAVFENARDPKKLLTVRARLTMDASDWGDVIRLSGAAYYAGVDPKSRFDEPNAPETVDGLARQEMNPITWTATLRETSHDVVPEKPPHYDGRRYSGCAKWVDSDMAIGIYAQDGSCCAYTQRRLVDRLHFGFPPGTEKIQLNATEQDYPLCQLPRHVIDRLEATEPGASLKNIVDMTPAQRAIIFADAKLQTLGFLYCLQTAEGKGADRFKRLELSDEFGTADRLPPKPYVREGLRLSALTMLREQDIRAESHEPGWAHLRPEDAAFGFQFHIDFHPTRRLFLTGANDGPWRAKHTPQRNWSTSTDCAMCPLRCFVPIRFDGLLGTSKNIGVSSIVQAALRLHGQMMLTGQASATLAWISLRENRAPRDIIGAQPLVREIQTVLARGVGGPGVALWPWHDLDPDDAAFEAANLLAVWGIWEPEGNSVFFQPGKDVTEHELSHTLERLCRLNGRDTRRETREPDAVATWERLYTDLTSCRLPATASLTSPNVARFPLTREEFARHLLRACRLIRLETGRETTRSGGSATAVPSPF